MNVTIDTETDNLDILIDFLIKLRNSMDDETEITLSINSMR